MKTKWVVAYKSNSGRDVEITCGDKRAAEDYRTMLLKLDPNCDAEVQQK